jgi:hypothetical protein
MLFNDCIIHIMRNNEGWSEERFRGTAHYLESLLVMHNGGPLNALEEAQFHENVERARLARVTVEDVSRLLYLVDCGYLPEQRGNRHGKRIQLRDLKVVAPAQLSVEYTPIRGLEYQPEKGAIPMITADQLADALNSRLEALLQRV